MQGQALHDGQTLRRRVQQSRPRADIKEEEDEEPYDPTEDRRRLAQLIAEEKSFRRRGTYCLLRLLVALSIPVLVIVLVWASDQFEPTSFSLPPPAPFEGALAVNPVLRRGVQLASGQVRGPRALLVEDETIYVSSSDGRVLEIVGNSIRSAVRLSDTANCNGGLDELHCGSPVGIRRLDEKRLLVVDAYRGLFEVDFGRQTATPLLVIGDLIVDGHVIIHLHDVAVISEDDVILSQVSTRSLPFYKMHVRVEHRANGRLLRCTLSRGSCDVLVDGLVEPRGLQLMPDGDEVLIAEAGLARIISVSLSRRRPPSVWAQALPGLPWSVRLGPSGSSSSPGGGSSSSSLRNSHVWVAFDESRRMSDGVAWAPLAERLSESSFARKTLLWAFGIDYFRSYYHHFSARHAFAVRFNLTGSPECAVHAPGGVRRRGAVADAAQSARGHLYVVSTHAHAVTRVDADVVASVCP